MRSNTISRISQPRPSSVHSSARRRVGIALRAASTQLRRSGIEPVNSSANQATVTGVNAMNAYFAFSQKGAASGVDSASSATLAVQHAAEAAKAANARPTASRRACRPKPAMAARKKSVTVVASR